MPRKNEANRYKVELETEAKNLEKELKAEFFVVKKEVRKKLTKALLISGGTLATIAIFKLLTSDKKKTVENNLHSFDKKSTAGMRIKAILIPILLQIAKKKIIDIINSKPENSTNDPGTTD